MYSFRFHTLYTVHEYMIIRDCSLTLVWLMCSLWILNAYFCPAHFLAICLFCLFVFFFVFGRKCHWSTWTKSVGFIHKVRFVCKQDENGPRKNFHCKSNAHSIDSKIHAVWKHCFRMAKQHCGLNVEVYYFVCAKQRK